MGNCLASSSSSSSKSSEGRERGGHKNGAGEDGSRSRGGSLDRHHEEHSIHTNHAIGTASDGGVSGSASSSGGIGESGEPSGETTLQTRVRIAADTAQLDLSTLLLLTRELDLSAPQHSHDRTTRCSPCDEELQCNGKEASARKRVTVGNTNDAHANDQASRKSSDTSTDTDADKPTHTTTTTTTTTTTKQKDIHEEDTNCNATGAIGIDVRATSAGERVQAGAKGALATTLARIPNSPPAAVCRLPPAVLALTHLRTLILEHNELSALPDGVGELRELAVLRAAHNQLEVLPNSLEQLTQLSVLDASYNRLLLLQPDLFQRCSTLEGLKLGCNFLPSLPSTIGTLVVM
jgi:Leucine rich repeat